MWGTLMENRHCEGGYVTGNLFSGGRGVIMRGSDGVHVGFSASTEDAATDLGDSGR